MSFSKIFALIPFLAAIGCADITAEADIQIEHVFDYSAQVNTIPPTGMPFTYTQCFDFDISNVLKKVAKESLTVSNLKDTMKISGNVSNINITVFLFNRDSTQLPIMGPIGLFSAQENFSPQVDPVALEKFLTKNDNQICVTLSGPWSPNLPTAIDNTLSFHIEGTARESL